jgi:hypothetical protein
MDTEYLVCDKYQPDLCSGRIRAATPELAAEVFVSKLDESERRQGNEDPDSWPTEVLVDGVPYDVWEEVKHLPESILTDTARRAGYSDPHILSFRAVKAQK